MKFLERQREGFKIGLLYGIPGHPWLQWWISFLAEYIVRSFLIEVAVNLLLPLFDLPQQLGFLQTLGIYLLLKIVHTVFFDGRLVPEFPVT